MLPDIDSRIQPFRNKRRSPKKFLNCHPLISRNFCFILATWEPISAQMLPRKCYSSVPNIVHVYNQSCIKPRTIASGNF